MLFQIRLLLNLHYNYALARAVMLSNAFREVGFCTLKSLHIYLSHANCKIYTGIISDLLGARWLLI